MSSFPCRQKNCNLGLCAPFFNTFSDICFSYAAICYGIASAKPFGKQLDLAGERQESNLRPPAQWWLIQSSIGLSKDPSNAKVLLLEPFRLSKRPNLPLLAQLARTRSTTCSDTGVPLATLHVSQRLILPNASLPTHPSPVPAFKRLLWEKGLVTHGCKHFIQTDEDIRECDFCNTMRVYPNMP
jgi:hypothetical protein